MNGTTKATKVLITLGRLMKLSRLDKPVGIALIAFPALWGLTLAYMGLPPVKDISLFLAGSILVRSAGCTINDILDRKIDPHVSRTKARPLAQGQLSLTHACIWLGIQVLGAAFLLYFLNSIVFKMAWIALVCLFIYPLFKRFTYWPQLFLGFAMNFSLLMAYVSVHQTIHLPPAILYIGAVCWTLGYDTIYAYQDKHDDQAIGVKSSALILGDYVKSFVALAYTLFIASIGYLMKIDFVNETDNIYNVLLLIPVALMLYGQIFWCKSAQQKTWGQAFRFNGWVGCLVWIILLAYYKRLFIP